MYEKCRLIFRSWNSLYCIFAILISSYAFLLPWAILSGVFPVLQSGGNESLDGKGFIAQVLLSIIVAPLVETFLYQWLPYSVLHKMVKLNWRLVVFISAMLFGLSHCYSVGYIISTFFMGAVFMLAFIELQNTGKSPFLIVCSAHSLRNLIALVVIIHDVR